MLNKEQEPAYQAALNGAVYFDLSNYGKIEVAGSDAATFLHNLTTNDIKSLPVDGSCEAFLCNARARTLAHVFISRWQNALMLDMVPMLGEKVLQHLDKHLISEQVELTNRTQQLAMLRLVGPQSAKVLDEVLGKPLPELALLRLHSGDYPLTGPCHIRRQQVLGLPGFDVFFPLDRLSQFKDALQAAKIDQAPPDVHEVLRIEAGFPEYGKEMDDDRFVMELGRTTQAISYTKGCYLGQEPIVMARDRGQVNRTLMGVKLQERTAPCSPGSKLFQGETEVGQVTSSTWSPRLKQIIALAYLKRGSQQPGLELTNDGQRATVALLPLV